MIEISKNNYLALASILKEAIGGSDYFNGSVECETPEARLRLVATLIIYRRKETLPEGTVRRPVANIVPVWWELVSTCEEGVVANDFSFAELKPYLIEGE